MTSDQPALPILPDPPSIPDKGITSFQATQLTRALVNLVQRRLESLKLYEPMGHVEEFHRCTAPERTLRGSNRSGKTTGGAVEVARAVTDQDPYDKYPKRDGRAYFVAKDGKEVSEVMYRKLFRAGAFKIIRDLETGLWRAFRPWLPADKDRETEAKYAPPLIPQRFVKSIAWENKGRQIPSIVRLINGWEISFYSSLSKPPRGVDIDLVWFDEEIVDGEWYVESAARLIDRDGKFIWSATPQTGSEQLYDLHLQSEEQRDLDNPRVVEFFMGLDKNPHLTQAQKELFAAKLISEDDKRVRIAGEFALLSFKVFPEFSMITHGVEPFVIPKSWTRYMIVDPGRQVCAVLFAAVPPPSDTAHRDFVYLYDTLYIKNCSAKRFGDALRRRVEGQHFYKFLIDHHGSRVTEAGSGLTIEDQYSAELKRHNIRSQTSGFGFDWGMDDVDAGLERARSWLNIRHDHAARLKVFRCKGTDPLVFEFERYRYARVKGLLGDKPEKRNDHLMDCFRYLAMEEPEWHVRPKQAAASGGNAISAYKAKLAREAEHEGGGQSYVTLGPSASTGQRF